MIWEKLGGESESSRRDSFHQMVTAVLLQLVERKVCYPPDVADPRKV